MNFKQPPFRSRKYLDWVKTLPCCHCEMPADDPHHVKLKGLGGQGLTAPDFAAVPLCRFCHDTVHAAPNDFPQALWMVETLNKAFQEGMLP